MKKEQLRKQKRAERVAARKENRADKRAQNKAQMASMSKPERKAYKAKRKAARAERVASRQEGKKALEAATSAKPQEAQPMERPQYSPPLSDQIGIGVPQGDTQAGQWDMQGAERPVRTVPQDQRLPIDFGSYKPLAPNDPYATPSPNAFESARPQQSFMPQHVQSFNQGFMGGLGQDLRPRPQTLQQQQLKRPGIY